MIKDIYNTEILQVRSDILFHDLFNEDDMPFLEWVAMQILECNYSDIHGNVELLNIRLPRVHEKERTKYVDLRIKYKEETILIELNNNFKRNYTRNFLYAISTILNNYSKEQGDYYQEITKVVLVNLNWFFKPDLTIPGKEIQEIPYPSYDTKGYILKIVNINLDYYANLEYNKFNQEDKLYKLLTIKDEKELENFTEEEKLLNTYTKKLIDLSKNDSYREVIMDSVIEENAIKQELFLFGKHEGKEEGIIEGKKEGIIEGKAEGKHEEKEKIVLNMYKENISLELISKCTGLSINEVKKIIESENSKI